MIFDFWLWQVSSASSQLCSWFNLNRKVSSLGRETYVRTWPTSPPVRLHKKKSTHLAGNSTDMWGICWSGTELSEFQLFWNVNQSSIIYEIAFVWTPQGDSNLVCLYFAYHNSISNILQNIDTRKKTAKSSFDIQWFAYCVGYFPLRHHFLQSGTVWQLYILSQ